MIHALFRGHLVTAGPGPRPRSGPGRTARAAALAGLAAVLALAGCAAEPTDGGGGQQPQPVIVEKKPADEPARGEDTGGDSARREHTPGPERPAEEAPADWPPPKATERQEDRDRMVATIRRYGCREKEVLEVMAAVPRHEFVPARHRDDAYDDTPLPIGYGQTISQPYMVAEMTRLLELDDGSRVLEVGTGSGYQAAVLAHLTPNVKTIEIVEPLAEAARKRLKRLGYDTVTVRHGDGYHGWPGDESFDAIIVTCATGQVPPPLVKQLKPGGRMVIPVGSRFATQHLMLVEKDADGEVRSRVLMAVRFVPLLREDPTAK